MTEEFYKDIMSRFKIGEKNRVQKELSNLEQRIKSTNKGECLKIINHLLDATTKGVALLVALMDASDLKIEEVESLIDEFGDYCNDECKDNKDASKEYELLKHFFAFIKYVHDDIKN